MPNLDDWPTARLVMTAARLVENAYNEDLAAYGITYAALTILSVLAVKGALTQNQLAAELKIQPQTLGKMVDALARKGFVTRTRHWSDRRSQLVDITETGRSILRSIATLEDKLHLADPFRETTLRNHAQTIIRALDQEPSIPCGSRPTRKPR